MCVYRSCVIVLLYNVDLYSMSFLTVLHLFQNTVCGTQSANLALEHYAYACIASYADFILVENKRYY